MWLSGQSTFLASAKLWFPPNTIQTHCASACPVTGEGFFLGKKMTGEEKEGGSKVQGYPLLDCA